MSPQKHSSSQPRRASAPAVEMNGASPQKNSSRASQPRRASAPAVGMSGDMTKISRGMINSGSEVTSDVSSSELVVATGPLCSCRSDDTTTSLASWQSCQKSKVEIEEAAMSELAALCSDDIPAGETRWDPKTGKIWVYSAYRSAQIAELDLVSIRNHWLSNCSLVTESEARTQEFVRSWLPLPCPALVVDTRTTDLEPEAEVEAIQETPHS